MTAKKMKEWVEERFLVQGERVEAAGGAAASFSLRPPGGGGERTGAEPWKEEEPFLSTDCNLRAHSSRFTRIQGPVAWSCGGWSLLGNSSEGGMELNDGAPCLLTHQWIFASGCYLGSWSPVQQEASHPQQCSRCPADLFQSLPDMADPWHARGFLS
uniref:uncharacterized protein LOC103793309 n=1 Tax=Callithrix jacchus TaxID=9483 RepID=UPI0004F07E4C|nr:uncharacterized protein LOC103793309 [Callithrix jacchus]